MMEITLLVNGAATGSWPAAFVLAAMAAAAAAVTWAVVLWWIKA